jgi:hypothetical protein
MITLVRGSASVEITSLFWDAVQVLARQAGWRPDGAVGTDKESRSVYVAGRIVGKSDAARLAKALEIVVNGVTGDSGELDLAAVVGLVNFLRGGPFVIK